MRTPRSRSRVLRARLVTATARTLRAPRLRTSRALRPLRAARSRGPPAPRRPFPPRALGRSPPRLPRALEGRADRPRRRGARPARALVRSRSRRRAACRTARAAVASCSAPSSPRLRPWMGSIPPSWLRSLPEQKLEGHGHSLVRGVLSAHPTRAPHPRWMMASRLAMMLTSLPERSLILHRPS